jgi:hypothetical protein
MLKYDMLLCGTQKNVNTLGRTILGQYAGNYVLG